MEEGVRRAQEGNFAFIGEAVSLDLAVAHYCKLTRSEEVVAMRAYAIAARPGESCSPVRMFPPVLDATLKPPPSQLLGRKEEAVIRSYSCQMLFLFFTSNVTPPP